MQISWMRKISLLLLFIGFLNLFLFHTFGQTGLALVFVGFYLFLTGIFFDPQNTRQRLPILVAGGYLALLLLLLVYRDQGFVLVVLAIACLKTLILLLYLLSTHIPFVLSLLELLLIPIHLGISYLKAGLGLLEKLVIHKYVHSPHFDSDRVKSIVVGLLIGLPVVFVLITMLSGADPIYAKFIEGIVRLDWFKIPDTWRIRILFSLFWFAFLTPLLLLSRKSDFRSPLSALTRVTFTREMSVVMLLVGVTLGSFLVIQAPYIFVNVPFETDLSRFGVATYSEYVTKGFFELMFVAALIYSLVWLGLIFLRGKSKAEQGYLKYIQLIVLFEFGIFLLSICRRIYLYQLHHGWSLVRIYGGLFVIWLTFITITLALRHFYSRRWVLVEVGATILMTLFLGFFNAEHFIATTHPPTVNKRIDYVYLSRMSTDGYAGWKMAYQYAQDVLVNRNLQNQELIHRDDRREVVYASMALSNIMFNYYELVHTYGTAQELAQFNTDVLAAFERAARNEISRINSSNFGTEFDSERIKEITHTISILETQRISINPTSSQKTRMINAYSPYSFSMSFDFDGYTPNLCSFRGSVICNQLYWWTGETSVHPRDQLGTSDNLFIWNGSRARIYNLMKQEIPHTSFLELQQKYFDLYYKIVHQPAEERAYDIDISFNTPFL